LGLLERVREARGEEERQYPADQYLTDYLLPSYDQLGPGFTYNGGSFTYGATSYPFGLNQTWTGTTVAEIAATLPGYWMALRRCPPAFAAQMVRALVLSQARFTYRNRASSPTPRRLFGNRDLALLERPWTNATTGELLARMEWHAGLTGNAYVTRQPKRLRILRPDWTAILYGSQAEPDEPMHAIDSEIVGYVYQNGGIHAGAGKPVTVLPPDMAHWSPLPDPMSPGMGMSWITPAIRDMQGDRAATEHKLTFFRNGATPNMVVKGIPATTKEKFDELVDAMETKHAGIRNAYRTLYLTAGADATVVGADLRQLDFKATQGAGETRIAMLSRVPAPILQISEGLAGSSLNAGNFGMARRIWADTWIYPTLQDVAMALSPLVNVPADAELWTSTDDMPILREDAKDAAEIEQVKEATIVAYVNGGFTPESAIAAVQGQNVALLKHTGLLSVQLQPPGTEFPTASATPKPGPANGNQPAALPRSSR
jgi:phage portal protein BeeE